MNRGCLDLTTPCQAAQFCGCISNRAQVHNERGISRSNYPPKLCVKINASPWCPRQACNVKTTGKIYCANSCTTCNNKPNLARQQLIHLMQWRHQGNASSSSICNKEPDLVKMRDAAGKNEGLQWLHLAKNNTNTEIPANQRQFRLTLQTSCIVISDGEWGMRRNVEGDNE